MGDIYDYILKNNKIDEIMNTILNGENILIIHGDDEFYNNEIKKIKDYGINTLELNEDMNTNEKLISTNLNSIKLREGDISRINLLIREIYNKKKLIIEIFNSFIIKIDGVNSLNNLYCSTQKALEFKDKGFKLYNILKKIDYINDNSKQIRNEINTIIKQSKIELFLKYKRFSESKRFSLIKNNIDPTHIDSIINKLNGLLNNPFAFTAPIYFNKYTNDFIDQNIYSCKTKEEFLQKIDIINEKHNSKLLNKKKKVSIFTPGLWFKTKEVKSTNKKIDLDYEESKRIILKQYEENIENLNIFVKSFSFLSKVFKNEAILKLKKYVLNQDELMCYIELIKNTLETYQKYLEIENEINNLSLVEKKILSECYDILEEKNDLRALIEFIPNYLNYLLIEKIESKNSNALNSYNNINDELKKLSVALKTFNGILRKLFENKKIIATIDDESYRNQQTYLNEKFKYIINFNDIDEDFFSSIAKIRKKETYESFDKSIIKTLSNLGYLYEEDNANDSILYLKSNIVNEKDSVIYINKGTTFREDQLSELIRLIDCYNNVLFIWYRNWWIDKNDEIAKINMLIN